MPAMTRSRMRCCRSGGKSRASGPAADDADGPLELDPVRVDADARGRGADQGADRVVGEQVAPDLLPHHVRRLRSEYLPRAAQVGLARGIAGLVLPSFAIALRADGSRRVPEVHDGGDPAAGLVLPVSLPLRQLVL